MLIEGEGSDQGVVLLVSLNSLSIGHILGHSTARATTVSHPRGSCLIGLLVVSTSDASRVLKYLLQQ